MYIRTNSGGGLGIVRRGMGATAPNPYPYCDPNYPGACDNSKTPWASQFARDPAYPYAAGGEWGKVNYPAWAAVLAIGNDGQNSNPVRNLYHLLPAGPTDGGTGLPDIADLDGQRIEPAALIAKAVDAAANGEYFPWVPGQPVTKGGATKTFPGWNFYNDNIRPGTQFSSPAQMRAAALSSGSRSTGMPPTSVGPPSMDAATQRFWTFKALGMVPIERLPEAAMPFYRQSTFGLPPGQTFGGPGFPMVCPNDPMTGFPDPDCLAILAKNPQTNTECGKPYNGTMPWNLYLASQVGCPATPAVTPQPPPVQPPQIIANPVPVNSPIPIKQPGVSVLTDPAQDPIYTTGGGNTPRTYSPMARTNSGNRATRQVNPTAPEMTAPRTAVLPNPPGQQTTAAGGGALDSAMAWAKNNPLILGGIAIVALFMFSQGKR